MITNETEERITHNIFYTAITRTKNKLKIYWSPETEKAVLDRFVQKKYTKDEGLLSALHSLEMVKINYIFYHIVFCRLCSCIFHR